MSPATDTQPPFELLTDAELRVVELLTEGLTNPQIAKRLYLSTYTVQTHLKRVFKKLAVTSRAELAAKAAVWTRDKDAAGDPGDGSLGTDPQERKRPPGERA